MSKILAFLREKLELFISFLRNKMSNKFVIKLPKMSKILLFLKEKLEIFISFLRNMIKSIRKENSSGFTALLKNELITIEEAKKAYYKAFYQLRSDEMQLVKLNKAFDDCKRNLNIDLFLEIYSEIYNNQFKKNCTKETTYKLKQPDKCKKLGIWERLWNLKFKNKQDNENYAVSEKKFCKIFAEKNGNQDSQDNEYTDSSKIIIEHNGFRTHFNYKILSNDFFERLKLKFNITVAPGFYDSNFIGFYKFWSKFPHDNKNIEMKVRKIIKIIEQNDPRTNVNKAVANNSAKKIIKPAATPEKTDGYFNKTKKIKEKKYNCNICKKSFNNKNTLADHINSKQHKAKIQDFGGADAETWNMPSDLIDNGSSIQDINDEIKDIILNENNDRKDNIEEVDHLILKKDVQEESNHELNLNKEMEQLNDRETSNVRDHFSRENALLLTCNICKAIFKSRGDLIMHLKSHT